MIKLNLGEFAGQTTSIQKVEKLNKCGDKHGKIAFNMKSTLIEEDC